MNLRHLKSFVVLAETLHFGEAARRLHMTQPPLSRQIAALEADLEISLFVRHSRSVVLTPAGQGFYHSARRILEECDHAVRAAQATARGERGELRIGFTMCAAWSVIPDLLAQFRQQLPDVQIRLMETLPKDLQDALLSGEVDVGISFPPLSPAGLEYRPVFHEPMVAVLPATHEDAGQAELAVERLAGQEFVTFPASTAPELHNALIQCCRLGGFEPKVVMETQLQQTIVNLVARELGVSLVPQSMNRMQLQGAVFIPLQQSALVEQGVYWNAANVNPCLQPFLDIALAG
ncbi:LysR family transcriptional regulator [Oceanobacter mangrovi]|uniref:LysR substrate-binding domain-containing protein n=1 Tax=Oceanobacter mangrovi TaxID=2862510 RepID=UPI001C8EC86A|nr:LysR family transcriptional regulator [Oceanobacter mangrovi]